MPKGKAIYDDFSKNFASRRREKDERRKKELDEEGNPKPPPSVCNNKVNKPRVARSLNIQPVPIVSKRNTSPNEGKSIVNASKDMTGLIHKPKQIKKHPLMQPEAGVISPKTAKTAKKAKVKSVKRKTKKTTSRGAKKNTANKPPKDTGDTPS